MKLVLHMVRKDFLRLRWPLAGWLVLVAAKLGLGFALVLGADLLGWKNDSMTSVVVGGFVLERVMTFVLVAMLVLEDALVGSTQFWTTRPISGARLLAAKLAGGLLLLWLPEVLLTLPWWLTCGFGGREMAWAMFELLVVLGTVAVPAALVASLTDMPSRARQTRT